MTQSWISYFSNLVKQHGGINLAQGIPGFQPPQGLRNSLIEKASDNLHQYAPGLGNLDLRQHIESAYKEQISNKFKLMLTNGGTEAIHLLYLYLNSRKNGLRTAAFSPVYESYIHLPKIHGNEFKSLSINSDNLISDIEIFFDKFKPEVFFVNTPGNPYGKSLSKEEFEYLIQIAEKSGCYLIIDAVYDKFYFSETAPYYPYGKFGANIFYVNSFSKQFSITGWRLGYFFAHESHFEAISYIHDYTGLCCPSVLQASLAVFLDNKEEANAYVSFVKNTLKENFLSGKKILESNGFTVPETHGGYFIWCKLPEHITDSVGFSKDLYENTRTAVIPGSHFGDEYKQWIRINIAREKSELAEGLNRLVYFATNYNQQD